MLDKIDPVKLNETLGALAAAFNGRGEKIGQTLDRLRRASWPRSNRAWRTSAATSRSRRAALNAYADAAPDLVDILDNTIEVSHTLVDQQQNLDAFLVSAIGLADTGNDVIGANRQALTDDLRLLVPTTDLAQRVQRDAAAAASRV